LEIFAIEGMTCEGLTREDINVHREFFRFLIENSELECMHEDMSPWDSSSLAKLHVAWLRDFTYECTEESTAAFFWMKICNKYWHEWDPIFDLDSTTLNGDTLYLLNYGKVDDMSKINILTLAYARSATDSSNKSNTLVLGRLVAEAIDLGYDLHAGANSISPLLRLLHHGGTSTERMRARLYAWLALLKSSGVDLHTYGQEEWNLFQAVRRDCERPWDRRHGVDAHQCEDFPDDQYETIHASTVTAFTYGEEVSDWKIWVLHPGDQYAGQFWRLIERNGIFDRRVPGGWVEAG
jgi:hypothetical protein